MTNYALKLTISMQHTSYGLTCSKNSKPFHIGDGCSNFTGDLADDASYDASRAAEYLQAAYGCNIYKEDIEELAEIIRTGQLNKEKSIKGIKKFIKNCKKEIKTCDSQRDSYLNSCIIEARLTLMSLEKMKEVKVEWCENFIKSLFKKMPDGITGIEINCFWNSAEKSGLWLRGTYGSPMSKALENLTIVETVSDENGKFMFNVFRLASHKKGEVKNET